MRPAFRLTSLRRETLGTGIISQNNVSLAVGAAGIGFFGPAGKWRLSAAAGTGITDLNVGSRPAPRLLPLFLCAGSDHAAATGCCRRSVEDAGA